MAANSDSVQIAVRMRPFNQRELMLKTGKCVDITGQMVTVTDPETGKERQFSFNYAYDSFEPGSENFASQEIVHNDLGKAFLENAWAGFNVSIFAYGQTGAGKSYSMTGAPGQPGIIPRGLQEMFERIEANTDEDLTFRVEVSFLEIYMEKIRDLFNPKQKVPSLKVRESPKLGIYVEGLKKERVASYGDVERLMELGNTMRTVAQTNMNATSSRSHSVLTVLLTQTRVDKDTMTASDMTSKINLIDLAGSERQTKTGAAGQRLKEGSAINQSLTALGNVIEALADLAVSKNKKRKKNKRVIPYRDSKLTRILQESLGGNAKTIMVAAISPAADNFKETLSTLRYANRASKIQNVAVVNESPNEKVIRELKEEVTKLREALARAGGDLGVSEEERRREEEMKAELEALRAQLSKQKEYISEISMSKEELAAKQQSSVMQTAARLESALIEHGIDVDVDTSLPHLVNLHNPIVMYSLGDDHTVFGKSKTCNVVVGGVLVKELHCTIHNNDGQCTIEPHSGAVLFLDGKKLEGTAVLQEGDRIVMGNNHFFRYVDPVELERQLADGLTPQSLHYDLHFAVNELAANNPLTKIQRVAGETDAQAKRRTELEIVLTDLLPYVMEANAIAKSMGRPRQFEPVFACDMSKGFNAAQTEIQVRVVHTDDLERESFWTTSRFEEELCQMKEMYNLFNETGDPNTTVDGYDPFLDPPSDTLVGLAHVLLLPLTEGIPVGPSLHTPIWDRQGGYQGGLIVTVYPATVTGDRLEYEDIDEDEWLSPGSRVDFIIEIHSAVGVPLDFAHGIYCKFRFGETEFVYTPPTRDCIVNHEFGHRHVVTTVVNDQLRSYLEENEMVVQVWACPSPDSLPQFELKVVDVDETAAPRFFAGDADAIDKNAVDASFMTEMMERMTPQEFVPGQYIVREGDDGNSMFFLTKGIVLVELPNNETVQINQGTFFGEIALFMNCRRTASIRAYNDVTVLVLTRETFDDVISKWPSVKRMFEELAESHLKSDRSRSRRGSRAVQSEQWMKKIAGLIQSAVLETSSAADAPGDATGGAGAGTLVDSSED